MQRRSKNSGPKRGGFGGLFAWVPRVIVALGALILFPIFPASFASDSATEQSGGWELAGKMRRFIAKLMPRVVGGRERRGALAGEPTTTIAVIRGEVLSTPFVRPVENLSEFYGRERLLDALRKILPMRSSPLRARLLGKPVSKLVAKLGREIDGFYEGGEGYDEEEVLRIVMTLMEILAEVQLKLESKSLLKVAKYLLARWKIKRKLHVLKENLAVMLAELTNSLAEREREKAISLMRAIRLLMKQEEQGDGVYSVRSLVKRYGLRDPFEQHLGAEAGIGELEKMISPEEPTVGRARVERFLTAAQIRGARQLRRLVRYLTYLRAAGAFDNWKKRIFLGEHDPDKQVELSLYEYLKNKYELREMVRRIGILEEFKRQKGQLAKSELSKIISIVNFLTSAPMTIGYRDPIAGIPMYKFSELKWKTPPLSVCVVRLAKKLDLVLRKFVDENPELKPVQEKFLRHRELLLHFEDRC